MYMQLLFRRQTWKCECKSKGDLSIRGKKKYLQLFLFTIIIVKDLLTDPQKQDKGFLDQVAAIFQSGIEEMFYHQALLIQSVVSNEKSDIIQYHICEYSNQNEGTITFIMVNEQEILYHWKKSIIDCSPKECTVNQINEYMRQIAKKQSYCLLKHNCRHVAYQTFYNFSSKKK